MNKFEINNRIKELIDYLKLGQNEFAKEIGVSSSRMSNIITHRNKPDSEMLQLIAKKFTNVSTDWLLLGIGDVEKSDLHYFKENTTSEPSCQVKNCEFMAMIDRKDRQIVEMAKEIGKLENEVSTLKKESKPAPYRHVAEP